MTENLKTVDEISSRESNAEPVGGYIVASITI